MASKKTWKRRAEQAKSDRDAWKRSAEVRLRELEERDRVEAQLRAELEAARIDLVRARADVEGFREAGRCLFNAVQAPQVNPTTMSYAEVQQTIAEAMAGLDHAKGHWLSVDPL